MQPAVAAAAAAADGAAAPAASVGVLRQAKVNTQLQQQGAPVSVVAQPLPSQQQQQTQAQLLLRGIFTPPVIACLLAVPVASLPALRSSLFDSGGGLGLCWWLTEPQAPKRLCFSAVEQSWHLFLLHACRSSLCAMTIGCLVLGGAGLLPFPLACFCYVLRDIPRRPALPWRCHEPAGAAPHPLSVSCAWCKPGRGAWSSTGEHARSCCCACVPVLTCRLADAAGVRAEVLQGFLRSVRGRCCPDHAAAADAAAVHRCLSQPWLAC